jgi:hypothetical protein
MASSSRFCHLHIPHATALQFVQGRSNPGIQPLLYINMQKALCVSGQPKLSVKAAEGAPSAAATLQEEECKSLLEAANALVAEAQAAAYVVQEKLGGQNVKLELQVA